MMHTFVIINHNWNSNKANVFFKTILFFLSFSLIFFLCTRLYKFVRKIYYMEEEDTLIS